MGREDDRGEMQQHPLRGGDAGCRRGADTVGPPTGSPRLKPLRGPGLGVTEVTAGETGGHLRE